MAADAPRVNPAAVAAGLDASLRGAGDPERAAGAKAYLKSDLEFTGTTVPEVRRQVREWVRAVRPGHDDALGVAAALWAPPVHERRLAAVEVLVACVRQLVPDDLVAIEGWLRESRTWALVDPLASDVAGRILLVHPAWDVIERWHVDADFWIRRAGLLALRRPLAAGHELDRFLRHADDLLDEREFFIRKAIGWVAREEGRRHPAELSTWLRARLDRMNHVTLREAVKPLPDGAAIAAAWRGQGARRKAPG